MATIPAPATTLPRSGALQIAGHATHWEVAFDENAIEEIQPSSAGIVALLGSGHLARLDPLTLRLTALRVGPESVTALGRETNGTLLAGLSDGKIVSVDPGDLALVELRKVDFEPTWVGGDGATLVAFGKQYARGTRRVLPETAIWWSSWEPGGLEPTTSWLPTTAFFDSKHRLWLGREHSGGLSGKLAVYDGAISREPVVVQDDAFQSSGVLGFLESGEEIYAYGGSAHLGFGHGMVIRVSPGAPEQVFPRKLDASDEGPRWSIGGLVATGDGGFLAAAGNKLWRVDAAFQHWTKVTALDERGFNAFRTVAMGDGSVFFSSYEDGVIRWAPGEELRSSRQPGQIEPNFIRGIVPSDAGLFFFAGSDISRRTADGWEDPQGPRVNGCRLLDKTFLVGADGAVFRYTSEGRNGCRLDRWHPDRTELLATSKEHCPYGVSFFTPDGTLWYEDGGLHRMTPSGSVLAVPKLPDRLFYTLRAVGGAGPPWLLVSSIQPWWEWNGENDLWRLDAAAGTFKARVVWDDEGALHVFDAVPWESGAFLLATDRGLRLLGATSRGETEDAHIAAPKHVERLARDGSGRLWLGGDGLAIVEGSGNVVTLESLPGAGTRRVNVLVPDPDHPTGVIAAVDRSIVFASIDP